MAPADRARSRRPGRPPEAAIRGHLEQVAVRRAWGSASACAASSLARCDDQPVGERKSRDRNRQQQRCVVSRVAEALRDLGIEELHDPAPLGAVRLDPPDRLAALGAQSGGELVAAFAHLDAQGAHRAVKLRTPCPAPRAPGRGAPAAPAPAPRAAGIRASIRSRRAAGALRFWAVSIQTTVLAPAAVTRSRPSSSALALSASSSLAAARRRSAARKALPRSTSS